MRTIRVEFAQIADAHREIVALGDQIDEPVREVEVELEAGMGAGEVDQDRPEMRMAEGERRRDAQRPGQRAAVAARLGLGLVQRLEDPDGAGVKGLAGGRQAHLAGGALQKLGAEPPFELLDAPADGRGRDLQGLGGAGQAAALDRLDEGAQILEPVHGGPIPANCGKELCRAGNSCTTRQRCLAAIPRMGAR